MYLLLTSDLRRLISDLWLLAIFLNLQSVQYFFW